MIDLFLDTDIILDFLGNRKPFSKFAAQIFIGTHQAKFRLYTSSNSVTTTYYILCKNVDDKKARILITDLLDYVQVIPVTEKILKHALNSEFSDFEDAVQHHSALTVDKIKFIITRNLRDYKKSKIKAISPEQLFTN
ncbi:MAG: PIN domain-containing protein [Bacteroidia bacterium]|jgi:predicted nucleic acid-binding protein